MGKLAVSLLIALVAAPVPAQAKGVPVFSWGKAGVTLDAYRADALECGLRGYYTDISDTKQAKAFVAASRQIDTAYEGGRQSSLAGDQLSAANHFAQAADAADAINPERKVAELKTIMQGTQAECLRARGYTRFALTDSQKKRLKRLKPGTDARRAFLFGLGSDVAVLEGQAAP